MAQGKRKDQTEFSAMMVAGGMIGMIVIFAFCIFTIIIEKLI